MIAQKLEEVEAREAVAKSSISQIERDYEAEIARLKHAYDAAHAIADTSRVR